MPNSQYIHEDVLWKETGFLHCEDVRFVSSLYYSAMSFFGLFAVVSLLGSVVAFAGSACSVQVSTLSSLSGCVGEHFVRDILFIF